MLTNIEKQLNNQLQADIQTILFTEELVKLDLLNAATVNVNYADGKINSIKGLFTINETKFHSLSTETLIEFKQKGYLPVLYSMLISIHQWNALIQLHNKQSKNIITTINLALAKDPAQEL